MKTILNFIAWILVKITPLSFWAWFFQEDLEKMRASGELDNPYIT